MPDYEKLVEEIDVRAVSEDETVVSTAELARLQQEFYSPDHPRYQGLAEAKGYDQSRARLKRVHYSHDAMVDMLIANPNITQNELAKTFDKSVPWISRILGSDAFQAALAKRREEITDPFLVATVEERFKGLAMQSIDIIAEKLELTKNADLALKSLDISAKSLGFGARPAGGNTNTQFIIQLPPKSANSSEWATTHEPLKIASGS